jgi:hypothetical protein
MKHGICAALLVAGCATAPNPDEPEGSMDVVRATIGPRETIDLTRENTLYSAEYQASRDAIMRVLLAAEADLGMSVQSADPGTGTVVHHIQANMPRIAGKPVWTWVDCGRGAGGTPRTSSHRITLTLTSVVEDDGSDRARVRVKLVGTARAGGMSADEVLCDTTGKLEKHLLAVVSERLRA